ncbi:MAG: D-galactarate dehydratase [Maritimibacter sp.]|nr:D-galactarate dehydratase [Maritimibacter sp.]
MLRPMPRPGAAAIPAAGAVTVDQFDTTSAAERAAAVATPAAAASAKVGRTVAALGNPADPGFWLETPLVSAARKGRVVAVANGKSVQLELRPSGGADGSGSRISLPALRLLEVGLTGLHELEVFAE